MKAHRVLGDSLRARFVIGMGLMMVPLTLAAVGATVSLERSLTAVHGVVEEASEELKVLWRLQVLIERANTELQSCLSAGVRAGRCDGFRASKRTVDTAFQGAVGAPFALPAERALLQAAWEQWRLAGDVSESAPSTPLVEEVLSQEIAQLDAHIGRAVDQLERAHTLSEWEMATLMTSAHGTRKNILLIIAIALVLGVGIATAVAAGLATSILAPVRALEQGAERIAAGDLAHRVPASTLSEFRHLAARFNDMANSLAKSQAALADLSVRDGLTGLFNYRELHRRLVVEVERSRRYGTSFTLLLLDVDDFKTVNDTRGHQIGDAVLRELASLVTQAVRPTDAVARHGGDELAILLPQTSRAGAAAMAERIVSLLAKGWTTAGAEGVPAVSASIGMAAFPDDAATGDELIRAADDALYAAKRAGGNHARAAARRA